MSDEKKDPVTESKEKKEKGEKVKKEKVEKPVTQVHPKSQKAIPTAEIIPHTGTRFSPGSARQEAWDIIHSGAKAGKKVKEVREILGKTKKEAGNSKHNLDIGYLNFCIASMPEFIQVFSDGTFKVLKDPTPDPEAAKALEKEKEDKRKRAEAAREEKKKKTEEGSEKKEKKEKKEKTEEKPSKKE